MKVVNLKGYMCDKCGKIYTDKYMAEKSEDFENDMNSNLEEI